MGHAPGQQSKRDVNFELNLVPFIDILSTCICFLLLTTVWINIGSMNVSQAVGDEAQAEGKNPPTVWVAVTDGNVKFSLKDVPKAPANLNDVTVRAQGKEIDWQTLGSYMDSLKGQLPDLKSALIMPDSGSKYEDMIKLMDQLKKRQITQLGISPL